MQQVANRTVEWNPSIGNQFASSLGNRIEVFEVIRKDGGAKNSVNLSKYKEIPTPQNWMQTNVVTCFNWHPHSNHSSMMTYGTLIGSVHVLDWSNGSEMTIYSPSGVSRRMCTSVAHNKHLLNYIAAGFAKCKDQSEFCAAVWDVDVQKMVSPVGADSDLIFKPGSEEHVSSIAWLSPHLLATGTTLTKLRVYDLRERPEKQEILSLLAHQHIRGGRKIKGIRPDPFNDFTIATFSDIALEPIKLWDVRKGNTQRPKITIYPHEKDAEGSYSAQSVVTDVAWSQSRPNLVAVSTSHHRLISFYSTAKPVTADMVTKTPVHTIAMPVSSPDYPRSLSWQLRAADCPDPPPSTSPRDTDSREHSRDIVSSGLSGHRLLMATGTGFAEVLVMESMGLALGRGKHAAIGVLNSIVAHQWDTPEATAMHPNASLTRAQHLLAASPSGGPGADTGAGAGAGVGADPAVEWAGARSFDDFLDWLGGPAAFDLGVALNVLRPAPPPPSPSAGVRGATNEIIWAMDGSAEDGKGFSNIERLMRLRARQGYSLDAGKNLQVLADEADLLETLAERQSSIVVGKEGAKGLGGVGGIGRHGAGLAELARVWSWLLRVDALECRGGDRGVHVPLRNCGVLSLLRPSGSAPTTVPVPVPVPTPGSDSPKPPLTALPKRNAPTGSSLKDSSASCPPAEVNRMELHGDLGAVVVSSSQREKSRLFCGWAEKVFGLATTSSVREEVDDIEEEVTCLVEDCEASEGFERAAALALWHGHRELAVSVLRRSIDALDTALHRHASPQRDMKSDDGPDIVRQPLSRQVSVSSDVTAQRSLATSIGGRRGVSGGLSSSSGASGSGDSVDDDDDDDDDDKGASERPRVVDRDYLRLLSLVALSVAGYMYYPDTKGVSSSKSLGGGGGVDALAPRVSMWLSMCDLVLAQLREAKAREGDPQQRLAICYLIAAITFLRITAQSSADAQQQQQQQHREPRNVKSQQQAPLAPQLQPLPSEALYGKYSPIVCDESLALDDRVAFACTFLNEDDALAWLVNEAEKNRAAGRLSGLVITGLSEMGLQTIQSFIDTESDIQTAGLIVCRLLESKDKEKEKEKEKERIPSQQGFVGPEPLETVWLNEYRQLLNSWEMYFERASLDVELGKMHRQRESWQQLLTVGAGGSGGGGRGAGGPPGSVGGRMTSPGGRASSAGGRGAAGRGNNSARILYKLPPHSDLAQIFLRCHFCGSSLPMDPMQIQQQTLLRKQRPVINCCPSCNRQLPRCYVCTLYLGFVNPNAEFTRAFDHKQRRKRREGGDALLSSSTQAAGAGAGAQAGVLVGGTGLTSEAKSTGAGAGAGAGLGSHDDGDPEHNGIEFGQWFFFCQRCRHGGHATCIEDWFTQSTNGEDICGVNGCFCRCNAVF